MFALEHVSIVTRPARSVRISALVKELQTAAIPGTVYVRAGGDAHIPQLPADIVLQLVIEGSLGPKQFLRDLIARAVEEGRSIGALFATEIAAEAGDSPGRVICISNTAIRRRTGLRENAASPVIRACD